MSTHVHPPTVSSVQAPAMTYGKGGGAAAAAPVEEDDPLDAFMANLEQDMKAAKPKKEKPKEEMCATDDLRGSVFGVSRSQNTRRDEIHRASIPVQNAVSHRAERLRVLGQGQGECQRKNVFSAQQTFFKILLKAEFQGRASAASSPGLTSSRKTPPWRPSTATGRSPQEGPAASFSWGKGKSQKSFVCLHKSYCTELAVASSTFLFSQTLRV